MLFKEIRNVKAQLENVKTHIQENKNSYIAGGVCLVTGTLVGSKFGSKQTALAVVRPIQALAYKSVQHVDVYIEALGDPGNIIQDVATGTIYASQGQAARELGLHASDISRHLSGLTTNVKGHVFTKIGKAAASQ